MIVSRCPPLRIARVFVSHSCEDHDVYAPLVIELQKEFDVWHSCAASPHEGRHLVGNRIDPWDEIEASDSLVFLASEDSTAPGSHARDEFEYAREFFRENGIPILVFAVGSFNPGPEFRGHVFGRIGCKSLAEEAQAARVAIRDNLINRAHLYQPLVAGPSDGWIVDGEIDLVLDTLLQNWNNGDYLLNAPLTFRAMRNLITRLRSADAAQRFAAVDRLLRLCYDQKTPHAQTARSLSMYIISRVATVDPDFEALQADIAYVPHEVSELFLIRCKTIALAFLGQPELFQDMVAGMAQADDATMRRMAEIDQHFHIGYYGSESGMLYRLREMIRQKDPVEILPLNIFNLCRISKSERDVLLLEENKDAIRELMSPKVLRDSLKRLRDRVSNAQ